MHIVQYHESILSVTIAPSSELWKSSFTLLNKVIGIALPQRYKKAS